MNKNKILISLFILVLFIYSCNFISYSKSRSQTDSIIALQEDSSMTLIFPNDSNIQYNGRIDFSNPLRPAFSYPGVSIKARFEGPFIDLLLMDYNTGYNSLKEPDNDYYNILIDDQSPVVLKLNSKDTLYRISHNLSEGSHTIEIIKRTESIVGQSDFLGLMIKSGKKLIPLPPKPLRKMEFIGNSITCGYGNEGQNQKEGFKGSTENNYLAYGAITSRNLHTQYLCVCYSGIGIYRNYGGSKNNTMPAIYDRTLASNPDKKWDFKNYVPDAIVVDLGTNDFYNGNSPDSAAFVSAYSDFINMLRAKHPQSKIFCVLGPVMNGRTWDKIQKYISSLIKNFTLSGDKNIYYFTLTPCSGNGSDYHPSVAQHKVAATELTTFIKEKMHW